MATEEQVLAAAKVVLTAANAKPHTLQDLDDLDERPEYYTEVTVAQVVSDGPRRDDEPSERTQWRIVTRAVGERYVNAQLMRTRAAAMNGAALTVGDETFHAERSVSDDPIGPDNGWWSGTSEFTC